MTKIYFAHPISSYNTSIETEAISKIKSYFQKQYGEILIINPADDTIQKDFIEYKKVNDNYYRHIIEHDIFDNYVLIALISGEELENPKHLISDIKKDIMRIEWNKYVDNLEHNEVDTSPITIVINKDKKDVLHQSVIDKITKEFGNFYR